MSLDRDDFDNSPQAHALIDQIQVAAWKGKKDLLDAPTERMFSLHGLTEDQIREVHVIGGNRITMPSTETGDRTFDPINLLIGILAGDSVEENPEEVAVYYPHARGGKLESKTVFKMSLSEAAILFKKTAAAYQVDVSLMKKAAAGMMNRFTFSDNDFNLHERDISAKLANQF